MALLALAEARSYIRSTGERWYEAELLRAEAELSKLRVISPRPRSACVGRLSCRESRRPGLWELRSAIALTQLWAKRDELKESIHLLSSICNLFTEGFQTADLQHANAALIGLKKGSHAQGAVPPRK